MTNKISDKDKKDWENFLSKKENLPDKDTKELYKNRVKNRIFDLHGYTLDDANKKIKEIIKDSYNQNFSKLTIVTGKGIHSDNEKNPYVSKKMSILKYSVPEYIKNDIELMKMINEIKDAKEEDGGSGAFYIILQKNLQNKFW